MATTTSNLDAEITPSRSKAFWIVGAIGLLLVIGGFMFMRVEMTSDAIGVISSDREYYVYAPVQAVVSRVNVWIGKDVEEGEVIYYLDDWEIRRDLALRRRELARIQEGMELNALALRHWEIQPVPADVALAADRLELLGEIEAIQQEIHQSLARLEGERAIRSIDFQQQRVEILRTRLEALISRVHSNWEGMGLRESTRDELLLEANSLAAREGEVREEIRLLEERQEQKQVRAPISGRVVDVYARHNGMTVGQGEVLLKIIDPESPLRVRTYLSQRNIDLVREGMPVRMESSVFSSRLEGYVRGYVQRIVREASGSRSTDSEPVYEVTVIITESPFPLTLGSTLETSILLGKRSVFHALLGLPDSPRRSLAPDEQPKSL